MTEVIAQLRRLDGNILAATIVAAFVFVWVQAATGRTDIATFIGGKIVQQGGYGEHYAAPIGWTLHFVISLAYVLFYAVIVSLPRFPGEQPQRNVAGLVAALITGVLTTWLANPAISITISVLAGNGFPDKVASIYFKLGLPLWNHLGFFIVTFAIVVLLPSLQRGRSQ